jgi:hypothetical protein
MAEKYEKKKADNLSSRHDVYDDFVQLWQKKDNKQGDVS